MLHPPPTSTLTDTFFPYTTLCPSHRLDVGVGIAAADEFLRQVVDLLRMIEAVGVDLVAEGVARLVPGLQHLILVGRHVVIALEIGVRSDADMLDADQPRDMIDMVDHVGAGRRLLAEHEHANARYAHHTALSAQRLDRLVGLHPWMIAERAAVAVGGCDRPRHKPGPVPRRTN